MPQRKQTSSSQDLPAVDRAHDPGLTAARERAEAVPVPVSTIVRPPDGGPVLVGVAGWTDPTLTRGEVFYPRGVESAEARLRYYASRFPLVEVDSTYYAIPARQMAELWVERTPPAFVFNVKAHALMTGHPTEVSRLPALLRDALPRELAGRARVYAKDLPAEIVDAVWALFLDALAPLREAGKLGAVLLQYPRWFIPSRANADVLIQSAARLGDVTPAVELRNHRWFDARTAPRTLALLERHDLPYVVVDEPQGMESSVPPVVAVTSPRLAVIRMHGHRAETWERSGVSAVERYRYLYDREQLAAWIPNVREAASRARVTHVVFNNCYGNYATTNALEMTAMLGGGG